MKTYLSIAFAAVVMLFSHYALANPRTITLAISNMTCTACPYIIKQSIAAVNGVENVMVSFEQKTATVTFDDSKTNDAAVAEASTQAGYPAQLIK